MNCTNSPNLYEESAEQLREENARRKAARRVHHGAVMRTEEQSSVSAVKNGRRFEVDNDLSRAQSSDFVRDQKGRKPVQFQTQGVVDEGQNKRNEERGESRNVVPNRRKLETNRRSNQNKDFGAASANIRSTTTQKEKKIDPNNNQNFSAFGTSQKDTKLVPNSHQNQYQNQNFGTVGFSTTQEQNKVKPNNRQNLRNEESKKTFSTPQKDTNVVPNNHQSQYQNYNFGANRQTTQYTTNFQQQNNFGTTQKEKKIEPNNLQNFGNEEPKKAFGTSQKNTSVVPNSHQNQYQNHNFGIVSFGTAQKEKKAEPSNETKNTFGTGQKGTNVVPNNHHSQYQNRNFGTDEQTTQSSTNFQKETSFGTTRGEQQNQYHFGNHKTSTNTEKESKKEELNQFFNNGFQESNTESIESTTLSFADQNFYSTASTTLPKTTTTVNPNLQNHKLGTNQDKNPNLDNKSKSTISLTRNDIVTRRLEPDDSDESQITQETSSFYKNSFNRIDQTVKPTTNPHPNHRSTYSDLKEPKFHSTKSYLSLSSVTPQYLTTQSINNGKPFLGSQVGTTFKGFGTTKAVNYLTTTPPTSFSTPSGLFNVDKSLTSVPSLNLEVPAPGSFNVGTPRPKTESSTKKVIDHATIYGKFVKSTATTPTNGRTKILLSKAVFGGSTTPKRVSEASSTTPKGSAEILSTSDSYNRGNSQVRFFGKVQTTTSRLPGVQVRFGGGNSISTTQKPSTSSVPLPLSVGTTVKPQPSGFFVTKTNEVTTQKSLVSEVIRPRPFQLPPEPSTSHQPVFGTSTPKPTYPTYKISSASPFSGPFTPEPTLPTPFTSSLPPSFDNVDSMITALAEMANSSRPGLVVPPSVGPQTLHTLAQYFANALDGIAVEKEDNEDEGNEENLTRVELEKKRLTELLTQMTMNRYNELFQEETTTSSVPPRIKSDEDNDLEGQHSKNPATPAPKVRQLAKVFTQALSSYLDDPVTFKKVLEEVRPTEPPGVEDDFDDELLNFSDADVKSSYPPFFPPKPPAVRPTWGYLLAYNTTPTPDIKNSLGLESENLQGADSQSFVSQFNKLHETTTRSSVLLPEDHWTTSPDATKLWKTAFTFNPASINENFDEVGTTESVFSTTTTEVEKHEIKYEVHALPQLELNSTQVHGILIDFMNTTKQDEDNRLQRILKKLNTTEDEFLSKMKEIEANPLTRRLILLLISECGNSTQEVDAKAVPLHSLLNQNSTELLQVSSTNHGTRNTALKIVDPSLDKDSQDARALQLLNSLYTIASRFGK